MRNHVVNGLKPREGLAPTANYVYYRMHEGTGTTLVDSSGSGPDLTVAGTDPASSIWTNSEWVTLGGDHYAQSGEDTVIDNIFRLDDIGSGAIHVAFDFYFDGDVTNGEQAFTWGAVSGTHPDNQGWSLGLTSAEQWQLSVNAVATVATYNIPGSGMGSLGSQRNTVSLEVLGDGTVNMYLNGALAGGVSAIDFDEVTTSNIAGTASGLTLFARQLTSSRDRFLSSAAGNARMARFFACKVRSRYSGDGLKLNQEMYNQQGELPSVLVNRA